MAKGDITVFSNSVAVGVADVITPAAEVKLQMGQVRTTTTNTDGDIGSANMRTYLYDGTNRGFIGDGTSSNMRGEILINSSGTLSLRIHSNVDTDYYVVEGEVVG